jgi:N-acetylmuramoyl-L-alanine amidase
MKPFTKLMLHHSLTSDGKTVSVPAIRRYHIQQMGMVMEGYHGFVELAGDDYEAILGRPLNWMDAEGHRGAACPQGDMNKIAIHICLIGNFDMQPPPPRQLEVFREKFWLPWADMFGLTPADIVFHREFAPWKSCPGKQLTRAYLAQFIAGLTV